jgi:ribosomal protein L32
MRLYSVFLDEELAKMAEGKRPILGAERTLRQAARFVSTYRQAEEQALKGSARRAAQAVPVQRGVCVTELCNNCGGLKRSGRSCRKCGTITAA